MATNKGGRPRCTKPPTGYQLPSQRDAQACTEFITAPIIEMSRWPRIDTGNPTAVERRIDEFFNFCINQNLRPSVEMLATALKVSRITLNSWADRPGWRGEMLGEAKATINAILSEMALNNLVSPTTVIWFQKNHEGYRDDAAMDNAPRTGLDALPSREDILKRLPKEAGDEVIEEGEFREIDGEEGKDTDGQTEG